MVAALREFFNNLRRKKRKSNRGLFPSSRWVRLLDLPTVDVWRCLRFSFLRRIYVIRQTRGVKGQGPSFCPLGLDRTTFWFCVEVGGGWLTSWRHAVAEASTPAVLSLFLIFCATSRFRVRQYFHGVGDTSDVIKWGYRHKNTTRHDAEFVGASVTRLRVLIF